MKRALEFLKDLLKVSFLGVLGFYGLYYVALSSVDVKVGSPTMTAAFHKCLLLGTIIGLSWAIAGAVRKPEVETRPKKPPLRLD